MSHEDDLEGKDESFDLSAEFHESKILRLDLSLARITDGDSLYGMDNVTVERDDLDRTCPFELSGYMTDELRPNEYHQSTLSARGQFAKFCPPGNLVSACLSGDYSSTTGETFVYMKGMRIMAISDTKSELLSAITNITSDAEFSDGTTAQCGRKMTVTPVVYIDDTNGLEHLKINSGHHHFVSGKPRTSIHARGLERFFNTVKQRAEAIGMRLNNQKTQMLYIQPALDKEVSSFFYADGQRIESEEELKVVGFKFGKKPNVNAHFSFMTKKFNKRMWHIRNLKRSLFTQADQLKIYKAILRPVLDFACVTYHSLLNKQQERELERLQSRVLKIIFGTADKVTEEIGSLKKRRELLVDNFAKKAVENARFGEEWFAEKTRNPYGTRGQLKYEEYRPRTQRRVKNPLFYMRKQLNAINDNYD